MYFCDQLTCSTLKMPAKVLYANPHVWRFWFFVLFSLVFFFPWVVLVVVVLGGLFCSFLMAFPLHAAFSLWCLGLDCAAGEMLRSYMIQSRGILGARIKPRHN